MDHLRRSTIAQGVSLLIAAIFGIAWARLVLGPTALDTSNLDWVWGDLAQVYTAWGQYLSDPDKRWLDTTRLSYPLPSSVALFDPMPILLLLARPFSGLVPEGHQFFGYYFTVCLVLQAVFGYLATLRALRLVNVQHPGLARYIALIAAALFASMPYTFFRFQGHTALSSQWVLVMSIWVLLATLHASRGRWLASNCAVLFLAAGLNPYLALMVAISGATMTAVHHWRVDKREIMLRVAALGATAAMGLFVFGFIGASGAESGGYGVYSMNLLGPLDSNAMARLLPLDIVDATGGQSFEGFTYVGLGVLLLGALVLVAFVNFRAAENRLPYRAILLIMLCCVLLAASATVTFSAHRLELPVPEGLRFLLSRFRGSGRLFWMAGFWLLIVLVTASVLRFGLLRAAALLSFALVIQLVDLWPVASNVRNNIASARVMQLPPIDAPGIASVRVYPAWQCDHAGTPGGIRNYESVGYFALRRNVPTNNFYAARTTDEQKAFHCDYAQRLAELDPNALYLLSPTVYAEHGPRFASGYSCAHEPSEGGYWICVPGAAQ